MPSLDEIWSEHFEDGEDSAAATDNPKSNNGSSEPTSTSAADQSVKDSTLSANTGDNTQHDQQCAAGQDKPLNEAEQARLKALRSMLSISASRQAQAAKRRRPTLAAGHKVSITAGEQAGSVGVVLDADYIENKALISLPDQTAPLWFAFKQLGNCSE